MTRFSILTPVFDPPMWALEECINSVLGQDCEDWEWILVDDASTNPEVRDRLQSLAAQDDRVDFSCRSTNGGIVTASNDGLARCSGDFVVLLDHDDSLTTDALSTVSTLIDHCPDVDYIYSDEDKITADGVIFDRFDKPDWAPERLLGQNYCCHLSVFRLSLVRQIGGFRTGFEGSQDYDLVLRVSEVSRRICHIPKVLYHWRVVDDSTAGSVDAKPYAVEAARRAVTEHLDRRGIKADVITTTHNYQQIRRVLDETPLVSIIIPSGAFSKVIRGGETLLVALAVESILTKTTYTNFEILLVLDVNEQRNDPRITSLTKDRRVRVIDFTGVFDFSAKCNLGAVHARGEILLFLNDDTELISPDWLETIVGHLIDSGVGIVGPRLLLEDGSIQSAGHTNDPGPHNLRCEDRSSAGNFGHLAIAQERSGITGACLAIRTSIFHAVGGMSLRFPHCFNDVDLCFKVLEKGYRLIWTPFADLYHFESLSRDPEPRDEEVESIYLRWGRYCGQDAYLPQPEKVDWRD